MGVCREAVLGLGYAACLEKSRTRSVRCRLLLCAQELQQLKAGGGSAFRIV